MSPDIIIRPSEAADYPEVYHILKQTWLDTYKDYIPEFDLLGYLHTEYTREKYESIVTNPSSLCFLAAVGNSSAGWMRLRFSDDCLNLISLYILPEFQGMGLGAKLLQKAHDIAREKGYLFISLGVMSKNYRSKEWYEKQGFRFTTEEPFQLGSTKIMHLIGTKQVGA